MILSIMGIISDPLSEICLWTGRMMISRKGDLHGREEE